MKNIIPFKIEVDQNVLNDLRDRLQKTRWPDEPEGAGWHYGTNPTYLKELIAYWQKDYDWRKQESALNGLPQFRTEIDGINIHFIHVKGKGKNPKPLLLTHGWPDSFYRFYKAIPMLTGPESTYGDSGQSFDVVIPSIPGFGFSDRVALNTDQVAALWAKLMTEVLDYDQYFAAGGDIGAIVTKSLANQQPGHVAAIHLTDVGYPNGQEDWASMSAPEQEFGKFIQQWWYTEGAYNMIQSTKPQTLGYGLNDSPAGLAAWIIEKFNSWSDNNGNIENCFTKDELITNIMIYWTSQTINTSIRTYLENARAGWLGTPSPSAEYVQTPTAVSVFPAEAPMPVEWAKRMLMYNVLTKWKKAGILRPSKYLKPG